MAFEVFNFTIENKFEENATGKELAVQVIPMHGSGYGGNVMPNIQAKQFKFTSSDGFIIFKIKCLNHEIGNKEYITVDTNDKVQLSITNKWWRFKIARKQESGSDNGQPVSVEVGSSVGREN
jgi:hypothetical protein